MDIVNVKNGEVVIIDCPKGNNQKCNECALSSYGRDCCGNKIESK